MREIYFPEGFFIEKNELEVNSVFPSRHASRVMRHD